MYSKKIFVFKKKNVKKIIQECIVEVFLIKIISRSLR